MTKNHYCYEQIERFTLEECKIAKLELQMQLPAIKAKLKDWQKGLNPELDGERLRRTCNHLRRLLNKVELRIVKIKQSEGLPSKSDVRAEQQRNYTANKFLSSALKPRPYHAVFCTLAYDYLDKKTFEKISELARQELEKIKLDLDGSL